ncbi:MAG: hypothetical protein LBH25_10780 [Fibromonadaceae bacterium]|jgi:hypothetical protein|nr:hypothetical protein [Fibromonadaceae bacterium]
MFRRIIFYLILAFGSVNSAPLLMLPLESDIDSSVSALWESSIRQILKETGFSPVEAGKEYFEECENVDCAISKARVAGAQGLFRGRLRKVGEDSISARFHIDWLAGNTTPQTSAQGMAPLSWDKNIKSKSLANMISKITGKNTELDIEKHKATVVKVEANYENAVIMLNGEAVCLSPCDFLAGENINLQVSAYWHSGENLWAAKRTIKAIEDTVKVYLELKRSFAETNILSSPEKAQVFPAEALELKSKSLGKTPHVLRGLPGENKVRIFHKGYNDTLVSINIDAVEKQSVLVQLTPIDNTQKMLEQNLFLKSRSKRNIGLGLLGGSAGPLMAGIMLCNYAQDDYKKARDIKKELEIPSFGGPNYSIKVSENHKAIKDGNNKMMLGAGLIGLSALLAGIGISMSF